MTLTEYNNHLNNYISLQQSMLNKLKEHQLDRFQSILVECSQIDEQYYYLLVDQLREMGLTDSSPVLYYFQINSIINPLDIQKRVKQMKMSPGKTDRSMPKINSHPIRENSNVLYVGKTNKHFFQRIKQHLGLASRGTYALHLNAWASDLTLTLNVHQFCASDSVVDVLEAIENVFHFGLTPLLGRSGR